MAERREHWQQVYKTKEPDQVSWFQDDPTLSVDLITAHTGPEQVVVDVGGGASHLPDALLAAGYRNLTVLDLSGAALSASRDRIGGPSAHVTWIETDVTLWTPDRSYDLWHDRAVFHFLTDAADQARYLAVMAKALGPGGVAVIMTFAEDGPENCSGLPVQRYSPADLAARIADLAPDMFEPMATGRFTHVTPGGSEQRFQYSLFRRAGA
jgi:trans-aconitate methyltransferase